MAQHEGEMARIGQEALGTADVTDLRKRVDTDSANRFRSREEMLAFTRDAVARVKAALPKWFGRLPKAEAEVRPQPEFLEANAPDQYDAPAQDGSRPGIYRINLYQPEKKLRSKTEVTAFHEIYPGHHLQIALAQEQPAVHPISQLVGTGAFVEGWGRYAEQLAEEMGLYTSPFARLGRRSWPGHGMVVDPGLHLFGWSRDSAIRYVRNGGGRRRRRWWTVWSCGRPSSRRTTPARSRSSPFGNRPNGSWATGSISASSTTRCWPTARSRCRCCAR